MTSMRLKSASVISTEIAVICSRHCKLLIVMTRLPFVGLRLVGDQAIRPAVWRCVKIWTVLQWHHSCSKKSARRGGRIDKHRNKASVRDYLRRTRLHNLATSSCSPRRPIRAGRSIRWRKSAPIAGGWCSSVGKASIACMRKRAGDYGFCGRPAKYAQRWDRMQERERQRIEERSQQRGEIREAVGRATATK